MPEFTDPTSVITVRVEGGRIDSVVVQANFRKAYPDAQAFSRALTEVVLQGAPPPIAASPDLSWNQPTQPIPLAQVEAFWQMMRTHRELAEQLQHRTRALLPSLEPRADPQQRAVVEFTAAGRIELVLVTEKFFQTATGQAMTDVLTDLLGDVARVAESEPDPLWDQFRDHAMNAKRILQQSNPATGAKEMS